jgi:hypothetical protein
MIFLWNPTVDDLPFQYAGLSYTLLSGKRMKVDEAMGNHVLNTMGSRGLTKLVFNEDGQSIDEEKIAADAIERNHEFKVRQIYVYNERNERRKAAGQQYDPPSKEVRGYAAALGIELLKPYEMAEGEKGQIGILGKENQALREDVAALARVVESLMLKMADKESDKPKKKESEMDVFYNEEKKKKGG